MGDISKSLRNIGSRTDGYDIRNRDQLQPPREQGAKAPEIGKGKAGSGASGSALTETAYADRTYWPSQTHVTTDGVFTWIVKPIKQVMLTNGYPFNFAEPPSE